MTLMEYLRTDEELKEYRRKWKEKLKEPFPPYNYDEFKKHFSKTTPFSTLSILVIAVGSMSYISFSMRNGSSAKGTIAVNSRIHTKAELEDMLANLIG